ncbi:ComEC/Rec2 family competence protein [Gracilibacillus sp. S3-1-1]|uniref:ComEC/Rec2 family competence protein n=1 Tax=Gracilibacillus pellucidus TaxID=3095368 RepID=A0ACC6M341_9BACI|nr:ComEC/Rec2 family competence protein [Gracilibacillus sp. S3-1-1]MDX8045290.1 ComEC/Rec2 family competence protein [Gracilibacillus sp. S3-1-1]
MKKIVSVIAMLLVVAGVYIFDLVEEPVQNSASNLSSEAIVSFLDVGQGDSTLLQTDDTTILIDTGRHDSNLTMEHLADLGVEKLDLLILTHPHADHIGNADKVVETYHPEEVWIDGNETTSRTFERLIDALIDTDTAVSEPKAGEQHDIGDFHIEVLHPSDLSGNLNNDSISTRITFGNVRFVFTGDAEVKSEKEMLARNLNLQADIYQVGHHGSSTSNSKAFVQAISPEVAIYSAGESNSYGHPHREILQLFDELNITLYGTDKNGTVTVTTDGNTFDVQTER